MCFSVQVIRMGFSIGDSKRKSFGFGLVVLEDIYNVLTKAFQILQNPVFV